MAESYLPAKAESAPYGTAPNGVYTLIKLIVNGFIHNGDEIRVWIPFAAAGKNVSLESTGNVSIKHAADGYIHSVANAANNYLTADEFSNLELLYGTCTAAGFRVRIVAPNGWFKVKTNTAAQNNGLVSVSFDTACKVTVSKA